MNTSTTTAITEHRTVFDGRSISEEELEVTESGNFALYVAERTETGFDEVHVFPINDGNQDYSRIHEAVQTLTGDSDQPISEVQFQHAADGRLILKIAENQTPEERSSGQELAAHLLSDDGC
jgi:hypothetical protein